MYAVNYVCFVVLNFKKRLHSKKFTCECVHSMDWTDVFLGNKHVAVVSLISLTKEPL